MTNEQITQELKLVFIHLAQQDRRIEALESEVAQMSIALYTDTAHHPIEDVPAWVTAHEFARQTINDCLAIPKFLWNSRPRITITGGWWKG